MFNYSPSIHRLDEGHRGTPLPARQADRIPRPRERRPAASDPLKWAQSRDLWLIGVVGAVYTLICVSSTVRAAGAGNPQWVMLIGLWATWGVGAWGARKLWTDRRGRRA
ncbi:hypothetical protein [Streptomyces sp. DSM 15324]|uniref:hypothetical protein n=1 Tax=Streptomyces sp. DSM 15324 TaxID=1739111 RepID=UPI0007464681|nr:hypothetical protein [Streptomyces sp. DSM 15324]KUO12074.1 hypothetical protein AQJ58_13150 [Streptomyces sp. DSM 15324]